jgi:hypothetical protein
MVDEFTWNNKNSTARHAIDSFLEVANDRIQKGGPVPFNSMQGHLVIAWLRALVDRKPSELE